MIASSTAVRRSCKGATNSTAVNVVVNIKPNAAFTFSPRSPIAGDTVKFTSSSSDPDGSIALTQWDLNGDGAYDDAEGDTATKLKNVGEAEDAFAKYLVAAKDPAGKAKVLLALGAVKISAHKPDEAQKIAEQIMALQPEGRVNAEARLLAGEVQLERGNYDDAGKAFKGVALLYDDPAITPRALDKAALAYRQAGKTEEADRLSRELRERYPNYARG